MIHIWSALPIFVRFDVASHRLVDFIDSSFHLHINGMRSSSDAWSPSIWISLWRCVQVHWIIWTISLCSIPEQERIRRKNWRKNCANGWREYSFSRRHWRGTKPNSEMELNAETFIELLHLAKRKSALNKHQTATASRAERVAKATSVERASWVESLHPKCIGRLFGLHFPPRSPQPFHCCSLRHRMKCDSTRLPSKSEQCAQQKLKLTQNNRRLSP